MEATTAAAAHAATAASVTATATTAAAAATSATSECRSWLNQADRRQCEQGYNRFLHYAFPPLDEVAPRHTNTFAAGLFGDQKAFAVN